jgi:hypothetical protein
VYVTPQDLEPDIITMRMQMPLSPGREVVVHGHGLKLRIDEESFNKVRTYEAGPSNNEHAPELP